MADTIKHQGIVESIEGSHVRVRIVQTSACAACSAKGHCTSADTKEKMVDVTEAGADAVYVVGQRVWVVGQLSMGMKAVFLAFVCPFLLLFVSLFVCMDIWHEELTAALCSLALLIPYYYILWLCRDRIKRKFSFFLTSME